MTKTMWFSLKKKAFLNSSFLWLHEGDKNKFYTLVILSLYKIPVTREPSRWPTSLKNSQSIHPPPPHPKQNFWSSQNWYDNRTRICWDWLYYSVMFEYKICILECINYTCTCLVIIDNKLSMGYKVCTLYLIHQMY